MKEKNYIKDNIFEGELDLILNEYIKNGYYLEHILENDSSYLDSLEQGKRYLCIFRKINLI